MWKDQDWAEYITKRSSEVEIDDSTTDHYSGTPTASELAKYIDHTQLKPDATEQQIDQLCNEAKEYGFKVFYLIFSFLYFSNFHYRTHCILLLLLNSS